MTKTFDEIIGQLSTKDLETIRAYIISTISAEFAPLIEDLTNRDYTPTSTVQVTITGPAHEVRRIAQRLGA